MNSIYTPSNLDMTKTDPILEVRDFSAQFHTRHGIVKAVSHMQFSVAKGECLGIVGESGSGKSVTHLSYLKLLPSPPLQIAGGTVLYRNQNLLTCSEKELQKIRGAKIAMIFQEPMTSLNPYLRIGTQLIEPLRIHQKLSKKIAFKEAEKTLERVGISQSTQALRAYPHEFSGGMRQRVMIAMAIITGPELLIADEPTTALDVTVQAQILELLRELQKERGMALILISHDLGVIAGISDRVLVVYAGHILEKGTTEEIFYRSCHPYTQGLLRSTPRIDGGEFSLECIPGMIPDLSQLPQGCPFQERCSYVMESCRKEFPPARSLSPSHQAFCYWDGAQERHKDVRQ